MLKKNNTQVDLLDGPLFSGMLRFAIPVLFSSIFQQLYNTMDTVIVGHTLGETSLAAIGSAGAIFDLLMGFALGMGNGLSIVTARSFGKNDEDELKKSVAGSIYVGIAVTLFLMLLSRIILYPFLRALHTPPEIIQEAHDYISIIMLFTGCMFAYNLCTGILRAIGNSIIPLLFLIFSSLLNVGLDLLFIVRFGMGIRGAAIATVIAQGISVVLCVLYILKYTKILVPQKKHFAFDGPLLADMTAQGLSMALMNCVVLAGTAILQSGINGLGYLVIAGHVAARKLQSFFLMPTIAMVSAVNTTVSQNFGAGRKERVRRAVINGYIFNVLAAILIAILFWCFAPWMVRMITGSEEAVIIHNGSLYLWVAGPCYTILALLNNTRTALQAIGAKVLPVLSSVIELIGKIVFVMIFVPRYQYMAVILCEPVIWFFMVCELLPAFWLHPYIRKK